ncbi:MAG: FtsX-like permease family protein [Pirellula sp.]|nr:FtsX-like permease family protein [Pirellula sp.]
MLFPVIIGVAIAATVIVGALIVGDSVRGSLRFMAMDRIGKIDRVLLAPRWFNESIIDRSQLKGPYALALLLQQASIRTEQKPDANAPVYRSNEMSVIGVDSEFWEMSSVKPTRMPAGEEIVINDSLAKVLHVAVGDFLTISVPAQSVVPADSTLGKRDIDTVYLPRWKVIEILPDSGLARFSLRSDQRPVLNAFADRIALRTALGIGEQINCIFATGDEDKQTGADLMTAIAPQLNDLGLRLDTIQIGAEDQSDKVVDAYTHLTTDQMLLGDTLSDAVVSATRVHAPVRVMTYLANGVEISQRGKTQLGQPQQTESDRAEPNDASAPKSDVRQSVPYSIISATESKLLLEMLKKSSGFDSGTLSESSYEGNSWVVINSWLANQLGAAVGDRLKIDYFLAETVEGEEVEDSFEVTIVAIAPLTEPKVVRKRVIWESAPTPFNDVHWTPEVPGITDSESINDWDTPFPLTRPRAPVDDDYWDAHGLTPKLFISYDLGKDKFGSRFGNVTSIRYPIASESQSKEIAEAVKSTAIEEIAALGWRDIPLRERQLKRSGGTTPFDALFLSLSFFLIASALLLVILFFRLSIERRANQWGVLAAIGWQRSKVRSLLLYEGAILSATGAAIGLIGGVLYAYCMVMLLRTWWVGAVTVSFLEFYVSPLSLLIGWVSSTAAAMVAIYFATRRLQKVEIATLLKGRVEEQVSARQRKPYKIYGAGACLGLAIAVLFVGRNLQGQAQAGAFVGGGMFLLGAGLLWIWHRLQVHPTGARNIASPIELAASNAKRAPTRSILAIGLVAIASFLILSMSLFQASPTAPGLGGFQLMGRSQSPIYDEIGNAKTRRDALGDEAAGLELTKIVSMRMRGGDDASCNNLYQADEPQVLGISARIKEIDRGVEGRSEFAWFQTQSVESGDSVDSASPWASLEAEGTGERERPIPVVLDQNTALWALHLGGYVGETFKFEFDDKPLWFETVGVLQNTILQGSLIVGEKNFQRVFPSVSGYRSFLVKVPESTDVELVRNLMEKGWQDPGLSLVSSASVLEQLLAVQNTYLSAFQLLGTLGLLLGTIGLGISQLRSAMERRSELAAMRAIGFTRERLTWLLALENAWQLFRGMVIGGAAAGFAAVPAILGGQQATGFLGTAAMLVSIVAIGLLASWVSAVLAMRWPLGQALRTTI